jgi:plasmid stabilization system protein ParE
MSVRFYPAARNRLNEIWDYSLGKWGEDEAESYVRGLFVDIDSLAMGRHEWRQVKHERFEGVFFARYRHHFVFFKELSSGSLGVITILHENMDIPQRLREDC